MSSIIALDARLVAGTATGDSTYWSGLVSGLSGLDSNFRYLLLSNGPSPPMIPSGERFQWVCRPSRSARWWSLVTFPMLARRLGAQAIHTQYNLSPLAGDRGITTIHDVSFFIGPEWFRPRDRMLLQRFVPRSARRARRIVAVSETSKREIERFIPAAKGKIAVAPNGPNPALQPLPPDEAAAWVRSEVGLERPFLLTVGTRWPRKNMALAIAAAEGLPGSMPHRLAVTGKPGWGEESRGPRTFATGYVSERTLSALYAAAELYLAPSLHEGFGIPLVEAFVCGCPVLCSSGGALPEVAGEAARVMESWEAGDWTAAITELLGDSSKLAAMREWGRERARLFTWARSAEIHERVYREVAE